MINPLVELVENAALARGAEVVPRDYIVEALDIVDKDQEIIPKYPTGAPSLKGVYDLALKLYNGAKTAQNS